MQDSLNQEVTEEMMWSPECTLLGQLLNEVESDTVDMRVFTPGSNNWLLVQQATEAIGGDIKDIDITTKKGQV